ncbi:MAG: hypothetical protein HFH25_02765 [Lachnospiraceae bacterium]|nr:hypothetical protein [Lachnospiraceae bacterium]
MRHIYVRGVMSVVWFGTALVSGLSGSLETAGFYAILGALFLYSAYGVWKKEKDRNGGR